MSFQKNPNLNLTVIVRFTVQIKRVQPAKSQNSEVIICNTNGRKEIDISHLLVMISIIRDGFLLGFLAFAAVMSDAKNVTPVCFTTNVSSPQN